MFNWVARHCPCVSLCVSLLAIMPTCASASYLERVLELLDATYPLSKASNVSANIAENVSKPVTRPRSLARGDRVIIGYDETGMEVFEITDAFGVKVPSTLASELGSGVSAGLYPVGSAVYSLPLGGQLSIFEQSSNGSRLTLAQEMVMTHIDGNITNTLTSVRPKLISDVTGFNLGMLSSFIDVSTMGSTALGAVNAGEIVTHVQVSTGPNAIGASGIDLAHLGPGPSTPIDYALAGEISALTHRVSDMGGGFNESMLALNIASNTGEVTGRVSNIFVGLNGSIGNIVTTTIGAVNSGKISN
ncbi:MULTISPECIES: hypothetical protein [unclassified Yoonia]|uniref:hypothetical protein n=1 Tax=unclassified Yoonia TaxID=2629118 RepID=UPI002AFE4182|nr:MULTISPECIES: hypothetical protein [unclassified Yoonia]